MYTDISNILLWDNDDLPTHITWQNSQLLHSISMNSCYGTPWVFLGTISSIISICSLGLGFWAHHANTSLSANSGHPYKQRMLLASFPGLLAQLLPLAVQTPISRTKYEWWCNFLTWNDFHGNIFLIFDERKRMTKTCGLKLSELLVP